MKAAEHDEGVPINVICSDEVATALRMRKPVVALETTILTFGLPRPINCDVALTCEQEIRERGAIPATVAILNGQMRAGLSRAELEYFCSQDSSIKKVNLQNFAATLASRHDGALTVAASLRVCAAAGIVVFATGGIGGVHRGYAQLPDISSDLRALSMYPAATICAGAKSILDIPATLEVLETLGVPVVGYGTAVFPQFFCRTSRYPLDTHTDDVGELARITDVQLRSGSSGILVATPVPTEYSIPERELETWVNDALAAARAQDVTGKAITPFMISSIL